MPSTLTTHPHAMRTGRRLGVIVALLCLVAAACSDDPAPQPPPDWTFFGQVNHVEWTGDFVVDIPERPAVLGEMEITLTDARVLQVPSGYGRGRWCGWVDPEVWSRDYTDCWIAGTMDEQRNMVDSWQTFRSHPRVVEGEVVGHRFFLDATIEEVVDGALIVRGYRFPLADDVEINLLGCGTTLEDLSDGWEHAYCDIDVYFDTDRGEIISVSCVCQA